MALEEFEGDLPEEMDGELLEDEEETPEELRKRLAELDEQAAQLKEDITKNEAEMKSGTTLQQGKEDKEEADSRSVYVGNVRHEWLLAASVSSLAKKESMSLILLVCLLPIMM